ncbi:MAG: C39 family peptidase [Spirochaetales bacterium]|nr:C39 family peptidase [Spirochaetales bacterium]
MKSVMTLLFFTLGSFFILQAQTVHLDVPFFAQGKDTPWAEDLLGNKSELTIRTHGCALTCIAMVVSHFGENPRTPADMNSWLKRNRGFEDGWEGSTYLGEVVLNWPALAGYGAGYVYTRFDWQAQPADLILIRYYLDHGIPLIGEVKYRGAPHYVVLTGYEDDDFLMNDPEFPDEHRLSSVYHISDKWGSGPGRNLYGIRVIYPAGLM